MERLGFLRVRMGNCKLDFHPLVVGIGLTPLDRAKKQKKQWAHFLIVAFSSEGIPTYIDETRSVKGRVGVTR